MKLNGYRCGENCEVCKQFPTPTPIRHALACRCGKCCDACKQLPTQPDAGSKGCWFCGQPLMPIQKPKRK